MKFFGFIDDLINWHISLGWMVIPALIGELIILKLILMILRHMGVLNDY